MNLLSLTKLVAIIVVTGCANESSIGAFGQPVQVIRNLSFNGVDKDPNGLPRLTFTLTNSTNFALCFSRVSQSRQHGKIDYFLEDGSSYFSSVAFPEWVPELNKPLDEDRTIQPKAEDKIPPRSQVQIVRVLRPSVYQSDEGTDMTSHSEFSGAFNGKVDLYAELDVYLTLCRVEDINERVRTAPYLFRSGRVGPFRVNIPSE